MMARPHTKSLLAAVLACTLAVSVIATTEAAAARCPIGAQGGVTMTAHWTWITEVGDHYSRVVATASARRGWIRLVRTRTGLSALLTQANPTSLGGWRSISRPSGTQALSPPTGSLMSIPLAVRQSSKRVIFSWLPAAMPSVIARYALPENYAQLRSSASLPLAAVCEGVFDLRMRRHTTVYAPGLRSTLKLTLVADLAITRR
ncbi:MAG: hypothetical protein WCK06_09120 [Actinomycetota bacterium]